jgi:hypothetical protein
MKTFTTNPSFGRVTTTKIRRRCKYSDLMIIEIVQVKEPSWLRQTLDDLRDDFRVLFNLPVRGTEESFEETEEDDDDFLPEPLPEPQPEPEPPQPPKPIGIQQGTPASFVIADGRNR